MSIKGKYYFLFLISIAILGCGPGFHINKNPLTGTKICEIDLLKSDNVEWPPAISVGSQNPEYYYLNLLRNIHVNPQIVSDSMNNIEGTLIITIYSDVQDFPILNQPLLILSSNLNKKLTLQNISYGNRDYNPRESVWITEFWNIAYYKISKEDLILLSESNNIKFIVSVEHPTGIYLEVPLEATDSYIGCLKELVSDCLNRR